MGGMYAMALTYRVPARSNEPGVKVDEEDSRVHEIAVVSREAESTREFVGEATALTCAVNASASATLRWRQDHKHPRYEPSM